MAVKPPVGRWVLEDLVLVLQSLWCFFLEQRRCRVAVLLSQSSLSLCLLPASLPTALLY